MDRSSQDFTAAPGGPADLAAARRAAELGASRLEARARIRFAVARGLAQGRLGFHYQPVVRAGATHFVAFHEMLARLRLPDGNVLAAGAFLPLVGEGELGREIDRLALAEALRMLGEDPRPRLSINVSPLSMGDADWLARLGAPAPRDAGGRDVRARLILEISEEAAIANADQTREFMDYARGFGCAFALDDFGAGATGFRHFREFRFDMVKLDGAFVQGVDHQRDAQVLIECLGAVARHFEMMVVAERVETQAEADWLRANGVDCLQGYLVGRPAARPEFPAPPSRKRAAG